MVISVFLWILLSGIGGFSYQTTDFIARNPIFNDLCSYDWPVIYDLTEQTDEIQEYVNHASTAMLDYYFTYWLPVAGATKLLVLSSYGSNILLYAWSVLGVFLAIYLTICFFGKTSYWILVIFILFGGLDIVPFLIKNEVLPRHQLIEWWGNFFLYKLQFPTFFMKPC